MATIRVDILSNAARVATQMAAYAKTVNDAAEAADKASIATEAQAVALEMARKAAADYQARLIALQAQLASMRGLDINTAAGQAKLAALQVQAGRLQDKLGSQRVTLNGVAAAEAQLLGMEATADKLNDALTVGAVGGGGGGRRFWWANLGTVGLFGGVATISGLHLLVDGIAEVLAVVIPAGVALTAFGAAAVPTIENLGRLWTNLNTTIDAGGKDIFAFSGAFDKAAAAVRPDVYVALGAALSVINSRTGEFSKLAEGAGNVLSDLAVRAQRALESAGLSQFLRNAVPDLTKIGNIFGNLAGTVGNLLKSLPGYAQVLLNALDGVSKGLEAVTGTPVVQGAIKLGLGLHGAAIYAGLAATAVLRLASPLSRVFVWASGMAETATATSRLASNASRLDKFGASVRDIGMALSGTQIAVVRAADGTAQLSREAQTGTSILGRLKNVVTGVVTAFAGADAVAAAGGVIDASVVAAAAAFAGATVAAAAFAAGIGYVIARSYTFKSATTQWVDSLQAGIDKQVTLSARSLALSHAISETGQATKAAANNFKIASNSADSFGASQQSLTAAQNAAMSAQSGASAGTRQFTAEQVQQNERTANLAHTFGSLAHATTLAALAHVDLTKAVSGSLSAFKAAISKMEDLQAAEVAVSKAAGDYNANLALLNKQTSTSYTAIQTLNSAWDAQIQAVTNTRLSFDNYDLGLKTLSSSATTASHSLGSAHLSIGALGVAMDGLTKNDLALNQAFATQVQNTGSLIDTWRSAGFAGKSFTRDVKDSIAPLVQYAHGSKDATAELVALATEANYRGPDSLKALVKWLGNTKDATKKVEDAANTAAIQEAILTAAFNGQGKTITDQLLNQLNAAEVKTPGLSTAMTALGDAIATEGTKSQAAKAARTTVINDLDAMYKKGELSWKAVQTLGEKLTGLPRKTILEILESGKGTFSIQQTLLGQSHTSAQRGKTIFPGGVGAAGGMRIPGWGGGDKIPIMVEGGEAIVPKHLVPAVSPFLRAHKVPGFASGGLVQPTSAGILSGAAEVGQYSTFKTSMIQALETAMAAATKAAQAAAQQAAMAIPGGFGVGPNGPIQQYARKLLAAYGWAAQWPQFNDIVMRESGWNVHATNPTSGAYGLPQALPAGKMASAGADWQTSGYTQLRWMMGYIKSVYGSPAAADAHERSLHWYGSGLRNGLFTRPTIIGVGERGAERVDITPARSPHRSGPLAGRAMITLEVKTGPGANALDRAVVDILQKYVRVKGGGDVQTALGTT